MGWNIIWDLDGTLFDTYPGIARAFETAFLLHGAQVPYARVFDLARVSFRHCVETVCAENNLHPDPIFETFLECYANIPAAESPPYPGVREVLSLVRESGGKNVIVTHRGRISTTNLLSFYHLTDYFQAVIANDDGFPRKPAPDAFLAVMNRLSLPPEKTLAVGDRDLDLQAANAAGIKTCAFGPGPFTISADLQVDNFEQLSAWLTAA